ncbi:helix-turn-helix domain-containing protein [Aliarcobacter vitoriensis]|uniref:helix-turn-helix domain-containing protein n=1 Tax=Aliarcobacter vitoriensis TaxID=2011099 RepID=UPI003AABCD40
MKHIDEMSDTYINNFHKIIGQNVKRIRKEKGISQLDLAHKIGHKSVSIISCAEINHKNNHFNIEHILKIAYVLEVDVCEFFKEGI